MYAVTERKSKRLFLKKPTNNTEDLLGGTVERYTLIVDAHVRIQPCA